MEEQVLLFFYENAKLAIIISLLINIVISILGVIPSFFLTAANITFFGFWQGTIISFVGEAFGAVVSFYFYRNGLKKVSRKLNTNKFPKVTKLLEVKGKEAFYLILAFRLFPFVPSGIVNIFAALGKVSPLIFILASSLGKIPALLIEAYSVLQITQFNTEGKIILSLIAVYLFLKIVKRLKNIKGAES